MSNRTDSPKALVLHVCSEGAMSSNSANKSSFNWVELAAETKIHTEHFNTSSDLLCSFVLVSLVRHQKNIIDFLLFFWPTSSTQSSSLSGVITKGGATDFFDTYGVLVSESLSLPSSCCNRSSHIWDFQQNMQTIDSRFEKFDLRKVKRNYLQFKRRKSQEILRFSL